MFFQRLLIWKLSIKVLLDILFPYLGDVHIELRRNYLDVELRKKSYLCQTGLSIRKEKKSRNKFG